MKKWIICACLVSVVLSGCGRKSAQDDMTTEEAIKYAKQLFADNVSDSDSEEELLENMIDDAIDDFMGDGSEEKEQEEETNHDIARFADINFKSYCEEELGLDTEVQTELPKELSWFDLMCISNNYKTKEWILPVEAYTRDNKQYENLVDLLKIEDCELDLNEIVNNEEASIGRVLSDIYNSNQWEAVIDSGNSTYLSQEEYIVSRDVDLSTEQKAEAYIMNRFGQEDTVVDEYEKELILTFVYYEHITNEDEYSALRLKITKYKSSGIFMSMETMPEDDFLCKIKKMGRIAVYREGLGWQWLWQNANVLTLKWDANGKRERLYQDEEQSEVVEEESKEWEVGEVIQIDTDYGTYLFSVTSVKLVPSKADENKKLYQITWEYENIDFGDYVSLPDSALHIIDSDGYLVGHRNTFEEGEALNRDGVIVNAGEKCRAYSVFDVNNEECEYLLISIDTREGSTFKVYVEK